MLDPQGGLGHGHWVWDDASNTTGAALVINDLRSVFRLPSTHRRLIGGPLSLLELNVGRDVVRLATEELLFVLLGVENWSIEALHLVLAKDELAQIVIMLLSLLCQSCALGGFGPVNFLGLENHFVESRNTVGWSSCKYAVLIRDWWSCIFYDCVNISGDEEYSLDELVF